MRPTFSIVTPVYNTPPDTLQEMISSVLQQTYADWELILVDDHSPNESVREVLREAASRDSRIVVIERPENGHIVKASNDGVEAARGEFVVLVDHDDLLTPDALEENFLAITRAPDVDVLYSDEDRLLPDGSLGYHFAKPDWSPWRLRSQNYLGHLTVIRTSLLREVGGFREGFEGSQDHDLVLRVTERAQHVVHIPKVLYHWRVIPGSVADRLDAKPYATNAAVRALRDHLHRVGIDGKVLVVRPGLYEVQARMKDPTVALVVVLRGHGPAQWRAARRTIAAAHIDGRHSIREIVVVHPDGLEPALEEGKPRLPMRKIRYETWSAGESSIQAAARAIESTTCEFVVVLDSDVTPTHPTWLRALLTPLVSENVGLTSGLVFSQRRGVANAGLVERKGRWHYSLRGMASRSEGPFGVLRLTREVDAIDGSCIAMRRSDAEIFLPTVTGLRATDLGLAFSAAAAAHAKSIVWTGHCRLGCTDYPHTDLAAPMASELGTERYTVEAVTEGWVPTTDRFLRLHAPYLLKSWRRAKRSRRKVKRAVLKSKRRIRRARAARAALR